MKPPNRVQVGPYKLDIIFDSATHNSIEMADGGSKLHGIFKATEQTIAVNPEQGPDLVADTLLHEILHACIFATGLQGRFDGNSEEELVNPLATLLLDTLRRNPKLVDFLTNREAPKRRRAPKPSERVVLDPPQGGSIPVEQIREAVANVKARRDRTERTPATEPWETT